MRGWVPDWVSDAGVLVIGHEKPAAPLRQEGPGGLVRDEHVLPP